MMVFWLLVLALFSSGAQGERILAFFPFPARSHHMVFTPVMKALALKGHSVTAVTPFPMDEPPPGYREIIVPNIMDEILRRMKVKERSSMNFIKQVVNFAETGYYFQSQVCQNDKFRELIHSDEKFDAVLLESYFIQEIFSALQHRFSASATIEILPCETYPWANTMGGNPYNPAYVLDMKSAYGETMSFLERTKNTLASWGGVVTFYNYYLPMVEPLVDECFGWGGLTSRPSLVEMLANRSLVLSNSHPTVNYAAASAPHFVQVAGLNVLPNKQLPQDLQKFMDDAEDGIVYFSLGSNLNVSDVATEGVFRALLSAFGRIKQRVLWKWEKPDFPGRPPNVKISKWFPQQDILAHKNCKVFITHGGLLSIIEAVHYGVPIIGVPFFGDQQKNIKHASVFGYGLQLSYDNITESSLLWALDQVLSNPSYRNKMKERSEMFRDRPTTPIETAVYWIEYVMRHRGAPHLRTALNRLPWYKYMLIDVVFCLLSIFACLSILAYLTARKVWRIFPSVGTTKTKKN